MFRGTYTAIVTPYTFDSPRVRYIGKSSPIKIPVIDEETFEGLINYNIHKGGTGIVVCGTTGESTTLNNLEHERVIDLAVQISNKRFPIIAGTGSNSTEEAINMTQKAEELGADGILSVVPYYNKPSQEGLYRHFKAIANNTNLPIILYNIKGRTGVNLETSTLLRLAKDCSNIVAVKEASGDMNQIKEIIKKRYKGFSVLSGDDKLTYELIKEGGDGVISVVSNYAPREMSNLVDYALKGKYSDAKRLHDKLSPLFEASMLAGNPSSIKYILEKRGKIPECVYRLPICEPSETDKAKIENLLENIGF